MWNCKNHLFPGVCLIDDEGVDAVCKELEINYKDHLIGTQKASIPGNSEGNVSVGASC